jgi:LmbE family N-acetylglucosaminyl deacetylase
LLFASLSPSPAHGGGHIAQTLDAVSSPVDQAPNSLPWLLPQQPPPLPPIAFWIFAHPDDETLAAAAAMIESQQAGVRNVVVIVSSGENTITRQRLGLTNAQVKAARQAESTAALSLIGISDIRYVGLPEGTLTPQVISDLVDSLLKEGGKDALFRGHSPYDSYAGLQCGHMDHCAIGRGLLAAWQDGRINNLVFYRISHLFDGKRSATCLALTPAEQATKRQMADAYALYKPAIGRYGIAVQSVPGAWYKARTEPECTDLPVVG